MPFSQSHQVGQTPTIIIVLNTAAAAAAERAAPRAHTTALPLAPRLPPALGAMNLDLLWVPQRMLILLVAP